jgi:predicted N-acetyltransferase YhbS
VREWSSWWVALHLTLFRFEMQIEIVDRRTLSMADARQIAELLCTVWQKPGVTVDSRVAEMCGAWQAYGGPEAQFPRSFIIRTVDTVIAHAEIFPRTIGTSFGELTVAALASVSTDPSVRGKGLGVRVVRKAFQLVEDGDFPFVLFQNYATVQSFYEKLGAQAVDNQFVNSLAADGQSNPFWADMAMVYSSNQVWPSGVVDLRGPGF